MDKPQKVIARRILLNARTPCQARQPQSCQPLGFSPKFGGIPSAGAEPLGYLRTSASRRKEMAYNKNLGKKRISIGLDVNSQIFVSMCVRFYDFYI